MSLNYFFFPSFFPHCPSTLICWLVYVESSLNLRNNANSIMVDNIFNVCLYSVSKYFIKYPWVFVYQGCCPVGFCHCYIRLILVLEWYWLLRRTLWVFILFLVFFKNSLRRIGCRCNFVALWLNRQEIVSIFFNL